MKFATLLAASAVALALAPAAQASSATLFNVVDPAPGNPAVYSFTFTATSTSSTLSDGGYQLPGWTQFTNNDLSQDGVGTNLLGQTWDFAAAASGSDTSQYNDGTAVNALNFGGVTVGSYDVYSQTFATTPGAQYTYSFSTNGFAGNPDGFFVTVSDATSAVPESSSWVLMLAGLGLVAPALRRRKAQ